MSTETRDFILAALKKYGPIASPALAKKLGMLSATVNWQVQQLHELKQIHVHGYSDKPGKTHMRIWSVGNKPDATRPDKFDRDEYYFGTRYIEAAEKHIQKAEKKGASQEQLEAMWEAAEKKRRQAIAAQIKPFRHWQDVALYGVAA